MKIFVNRNACPGLPTISDDSTDGSISELEALKLANTAGKSTLQLIFYDGSKTIKIFKEMYLNNKDAYFVVKNMELFMYKIRIFRNIEIKIKNEELKIENNEREKKYKKISKQFNENVEKGIEMSFKPAIYNGIRTSLLNYKKYKVKEMVVHRVIKKLQKDAKVLDELSLNDEELRVLKSLIFAGIVLKKGEVFELVGWMKM